MTIGIKCVSPVRMGVTRPPTATITSGFNSHKVRRCGANEVHVVTGPTLVELNVDTGGPTSFSQFISESPQAHLHFSVLWREWHQDADSAHALNLRAPMPWP